MGYGAVDSGAVGVFPLYARRGDRHPFTRMIGADFETGDAQL